MMTDKSLNPTLRTEPVFPEYSGELPAVLDPLNPRHYLLLAYWVYFRPTALKRYLYNADPELYRNSRGINFFRAARHPAYRNLYVTAIIVMLLANIIISLPFPLWQSLMVGNSKVWLDWWFGVEVGVAVGVTSGVAVGVTGGVAVGVAGGVAWGLAFGVVGGVAWGVTGGGAVGEAFGVVLGEAFGVAFGVVLGVVVGVAGGEAFGVAFGVVVGLAGGLASSLAGGLAVGAGALRLLFYPVQAWQVWGEGYHPLFNDELLVLPLPNSVPALLRQFRRSEETGLQKTGQVIANPFQRWVVQRVLYTYTHRHTQPLARLYRVINAPVFAQYTFAPIIERDWNKIPALRQLVVGELALFAVDGSGGEHKTSENIVWRLTQPLRIRTATPVTRFAAMMYTIMYEETEETIAAPGFNLDTHRATYTGLKDYADGAEIARTFGFINAFLKVTSLAMLAETPAVENSLLAITNPIRPAVVSALRGLTDVGREVQTSLEATSRVKRLAALARANDALRTLSESVATDVPQPEQPLLLSIIRRWRELITAAAGQAGSEKITAPVKNPYIAGNPVRGKLFVGRKDELRQLEELWTSAKQVSSVVLYGHRRMGKSSILQNLGHRFGANYRIVDFNMQRIGIVHNTSQLLYRLANELYDNLPAPARRKIAEPQETGFAGEPTYTFDRFLKAIDAFNLPQRFIIAIDEFEILEDLILDGKLDAHLLDFFRSLFQKYAWLVMIFAGVHSLNEMTADWWHPLFSGVVSIPVSFLSKTAARELITQPSEDFPLDYTEEAIAEIIDLTAGQPYLIQQIGHNLVTRYNRQKFEEKTGHDDRLTLADVTAVVNAARFFRDSSMYFKGIWEQASDTPRVGDALPHQQSVLRILATARAGMSMEELIREANLSHSAVKTAIDALKRHDVIRQREGRWYFTVELMRRWVLKSDAGVEKDS